MNRLFGTDGIRGEAGVFPLDTTTVHFTGRSLAHHLSQTSTETGEKKIPLLITGRDTRESGAWIEGELIAGAQEMGARCLSAGVITTPGVAFLTRDMNADAGVVISASHNPYQDNGIKIFAPSGKKLEDALERLIESDIICHQEKSHANDAPPLSHSVTDNSIASDLLSRYLRYLYEDIGAGLSIRGLRIVLDCANGAASEFALPFFKRFGGEVLAINNAPNGRNINQDCGSLNTASLTTTVLREHADLGIAFDGDADRALFVDAKGNLIDGDATLWIMAGYLQKSGRLNGHVVATVMSNMGLEIALRTREIQLLRTDVGDKYVLDEILRTGAILGGEQSGHIIFPEQSLSGDGILTTLNLLRVMAESGRALDALAEGFVRYPQILLNVTVREKLPFEQIPEIWTEAKGIEAHLGDRGRLLLRYSGTEPLARVMMEGVDQPEIEELARQLASAIKKSLG